MRLLSHFWKEGWWLVERWESRRDLFRYCGKVTGASEGGRQTAVQKDSSMTWQFKRSWTLLVQFFSDISGPSALRDLLTGKIQFLVQAFLLLSLGFIEL